jgi:glutamate dehydrogenase
MATATTDVIGVQDTTKMAMCRRDSSGYTVNVFEGKQEQMLKVCEHIQETGFIPKELVQNEVTWFYG